MTRKTVCLLLLVVVLAIPVFAQSNRDRWMQPEKIMRVIGVKKGMVIGEAGAGRGYFTFKLARKVGPSGKIYANDINEDALEEIRLRCQTEDVTNIVTIKGTVTNPLFPEGGLDMVFMCYALHDFDYPREFLQNLKPSFKPGAHLVIVDQDPAKSGRGHNHFFSKEKMISVVRSAGYRLIRVENFLVRDNIYIFEL